MSVSNTSHGLRFAYSTINWGAECDLPAALDDIRTTGWGAVELFGHSLDLLGTPSRMTAELSDLAPATLFSGISFPLTGPQTEKLKNHIRFASEVGAEAFGLVGGARLRWRPPTSQEVAELASFCEELARFGKDMGVVVSYHPHVGCTIETSEEIDQLLQHTQELKLCLDASHIALVGEDPRTVIAHHWERIGYIHLKDWGDGKFQELGRGTIGIDFAAILKMLEERAFGGWIVLEQSQSDQSPLQSARINAEYVRALGYDIG